MWQRDGSFNLTSAITGTSPKAGIEMAARMAKLKGVFWDVFSTFIHSAKNEK